MTKEEKILQKWNKIVAELSEKFADGDTLNIDSILYLIGIQELGKGPQEFSKDDKINLMHIAVCRLLEPYGYYKFDSIDSDGWPHYNLLKKLPDLKIEEQTRLIKSAIIDYFKEIITP